MVRTARECSLNPSEPEEDFLNEFLKPYVDAGHVKARRGAPFYLDKARTSKILNGKADVPTALRQSLIRRNMEKDTAQNFQTFADKRFDDQCFMQLVCAIADLLGDEDAALKHQLGSLRNDRGRYFARCLIAALREPNASESKLVVWQNGTGSFAVDVGDLLDKGFGRAKKHKNIVVVPVNTTFSTEVSYAYERALKPLVAAKSIHGQWLSRMFEKGENSEVLAARIQEDLTGRGLSSNKITGDSTAATFEYPVGTVSSLEGNKAVFYLLAIASFDDNNNAQSTPESIKSALLEMIDTYDKHGQGLDLYMPLLGTGMSRAGLSHQQSYELIEGVISENKKRVHGKITLMVHPQDKEKLGIKL